MGTHQLFIYALSDVLLQNINQDVAVGIILLLIIIVLDIPVVFILDRYLPFLVGRKSVNALLGCHDLALSCCHEIARISVMECSL